MLMYVDDDGKPRRTGTEWTASAHIITAIIGSGVLSQAWAMAQLGWIAGIGTLLIFSFITLYTSTLLADSYRFPDPVTGKRNHTFMEAVEATLVPFFNDILALLGAIGYWPMTLNVPVEMYIARKKIQRG
ncbi:hypothetical protein DKX38_010516 [Salix brachista]|uniref:Amino acid transporter transmembrane domain-containing protein n=1 Tax=Salix brachista TaxID=2182728 RepID=A0A5N5MDH9_9ROSI|nr:hypothetical protein DKX38_010516 [Salix brachista]